MFVNSKETVGPWDTTVGSLRIHFPSALLRTGFLRIPSILCLIFLLTPVVVLGHQLLPRMLLLAVGLAVLSSFALWLAFIGSAAGPEPRALWVKSKQHNTFLSDLCF